MTAIFMVTEDDISSVRRLPQREGLRQPDNVQWARSAATFGAYAAMLALYQRDANGGTGQMIDLALYEPPFRITASLVAGWEKTGQNRERIGNRNPGFAPAGTFETNDGRYVQIAAGGDNVWQRLATIMGGIALAEDKRFLKSRDRIKRADELERLLGDWIRSRSFEDIERQLVAAGVPVGGIYRAEDIAQDPHYRARDSLIEVEDAEQGSITMPGVVPKLSETPGSVEWTGPKLGAHNEEIYGDLLGKGIDDLADLASRGII